MNQTATLQHTKTASLDSLYALISKDLKLVDACILDRVKSEVPLIYDIARHIIASGGKRIRPALTLICAQLCGYTYDRHIPLAAAVEFIHTATLLHDDVVDESKLRRGLATANELFGNKGSVLVGDFLLSQAFQLMVSDGSLKVLKILSDSAAIISKGEVMQLMTEGQPETSIEHYLQVISSKTAVLFAAACELGAVISGQEDCEEPLREFGIYIGIAFQLIDDALDYGADQETLGKTVGDDFQEGKITLPVIIAYNVGSPEERAFWMRTLGELVQKPADFDYALSLLNKHQALDQTVAMAERYCNKARQSLMGFPASPARAAMLDIVDFCSSRAY
jgi:octaprenyl-diphosphate synthase